MDNSTKHKLNTQSTPVNLSERIFKHEQVATNTFTNDTLITCSAQHTLIGFIGYTKIRLLPYYIIHSFYVYPQYRCQGHGHALLSQACKTIESNGGKRIYIQPGPFEIRQGNVVAIDNSIIFKQQLEKLVDFYQKRGFISVYPCTKLIAQFLYKIMHIDENPEYLMVKSCT